MHATTLALSFPAEPARPRPQRLGNSANISTQRSLRHKDCMGQIGHYMQRSIPKIARAPTAGGRKASVGLSRATNPVRASLRQKQITVLGSKLTVSEQFHHLHQIKPVNH